MMIQVMLEEAGVNDDTSYVRDWVNDDTSYVRDWVNDDTSYVRDWVKEKKKGWGRGKGSSVVEKNQGATTRE